MNTSPTENAQKHNHKRLKVKVSKTLYDILITHCAFKNNWKAISPAVYFLRDVSNKTWREKDKYSDTYHSVQIPSVYISATFRPYTDGEYTQYLDALVDLKLLEIDHSYVAAKDAHDNQGQCKHYTITEYGYQSLCANDLEYLHNLHNDKATKRRNQKAVSQRKSQLVESTDYLIGYMTDLQNHLSVNVSKVTEYIHSMPNNFGKANAATAALKVETATYDECFYNESDGRLVTTYTNIPAQMKSMAAYKTKSHAAVVDIRSCHPTFFSLYIKSIYIDDETHFPFVDGATLESEHQKWLALFTNKDIDPKQVIATACKRDIDWAKEALIKTINGHKGYTVLLDYIKTNFPTLFAIWSTTDAATTGVAICKKYETPLMLDVDLYDLAKQFDIKLGYENDGFSIFSESNNKFIESQAKFLIGYVKAKCKRLFGINLILSLKINNTKQIL